MTDDEARRQLAEAVRPPPREPIGDGMDVARETMPSLHLDRGKDIGPPREEPPKIDMLRAFRFFTRGRW